MQAVGTAWKKGVSSITRKGKVIQKEILELITNTELPVSTRQLTIHLKYSWNTIQRHCLELLFRKKIERIEIASSHLWIQKGKWQFKENKETEDNMLNELLEDEIESQIKALKNKLESRNNTRSKQDKEKTMSKTM